MARYQIAITDYLLALIESGDALPWPGGFRLGEVTDEQAGPGARWCWVDDDGAPASAEGQRLEVTFNSVTDDIGARVVTVANRRLISESPRRTATVGHA